MEPQAAIEFPQGFMGQVIRPNDAAYDDARAVVNGMIDRRPAVIVRPAGAADVIDAVNFAREHGLAVAAECGGHNVAGNGRSTAASSWTCRASRACGRPCRARAPARRPGRCGASSTARRRLFGLATPGGRVTRPRASRVHARRRHGWLSPKYGLACDNLVAADVVTADGRLVKASEDENPDLLWGLRGGGSNFGIVTSFEFALHPVGPMVLAGMLIHPVESAPQVIRAYRDFIESAPEELATALAFVQAPPAPFVPPEMVGTPVLGLIAFYIGDVDAGTEAAAGLRAIGPPAMDLVQPMPYTAFQAMLDESAPSGWQNYHRGEHLTEFSDAAIDAFVTAGPQRISPMTQAIVFRTGGAVSRVPAESTAASHRASAYMAHPLGCWQDAADDEINMAWVTAFSDAMRPFATGGVYLNFEQDQGEEIVRRGYTPQTYARLVALKDKWDPRNLFRVNQNIAPSQSAVR